MRKVVKIVNAIGLISVILLFYWIFIFLLISVFDLKVFQKNITQFFYMSILGILSLMFGSLMISFMFNISIVAESMSGKKEIEVKKSESKKKSSFLKITFIVILIVTTVFLFSGHYLSIWKNKRLMIESVKNVTQTYKKQLDSISDYQFNYKYIKKVNNFVRVVSKVDKEFNNIEIIVLDKIDKMDTYLFFKEEYDYNLKSEKKYKKINFIFRSGIMKKKYLDSVFKNKNKAYKIFSKDGKYELLYPYETKKRKVVLYFSNSKEYGEVGYK